MAAMTTLGQLAKSYRQVTGDMAKVSTTTLREAALIVEASVATASGRYKGSRLTRTSSKVVGAGSTAIAVVRMPSRLAHLLDHDTKAHPIGLKNAKAFHLGGTPEGFAAGPINHPGTKGKLMWEIGTAAALPLISKMAGAQYDGMLVKAFL